MKVGILGLGLIGGSMARAYTKAGHQVYADDKDNSILEFSQLAGVVSGGLTEEMIAQCELIILSIYADAAASWLEEKGKYISANAFVIDCCGVKTDICKRCFAVADKYGFTFVGGHPMAGSHNSGFKYSRSNLFQGAPMVIVPPIYDDPELLQKAKELLAPCGFKSFSVTTAEEHDAMIAFTSQMPHVISNAFIKSPTAKQHKGFSAGSYKDLTRVAWLNPTMWTELFLSNKDHLLKELDIYISALNQYKEALTNNDAQTLCQLLDEGRRRKEEVDG